MVGIEIKQAINDVRDLKIKVIEGQLFRGYSGIARILSGGVTLAAAIIMSRPSYPSNSSYQMGGWALVYTIAVLLNGGALFGRFLSKSRGLADWVQLRPVWDVVPPLLTACVLTMHLFLVDQLDSMFGIWMMMYGLIHLCSRHSLPRYSEHVGWYYLLCGTYFLIRPVSFLNPWPMGIVFFVGEVVGGMIFLSAAKKEV
jgi:hypothetical protein